MVSGVESLFKNNGNYTVDKAIVNINRPAVYSINQRSKSTV